LWNQLLSFCQPRANCFECLLPLLELLIKSCEACLQGTDGRGSGLQLGCETVPFSGPRTGCAKIGLLASEVRFQISDSSSCQVEICHDGGMRLKSGYVFFARNELLLESRDPLTGLLQFAGRDRHLAGQPVSFWSQFSQIGQLRFLGVQQLLVGRDGRTALAISEFAFEIANAVVEFAERGQ
jgi:hypothetical protein